MSLPCRRRPRRRPPGRPSPSRSQPVRTPRRSGPVRTRHRSAPTPTPPPSPVPRPRPHRARERPAHRQPAPGGREARHARSSLGDPMEGVEPTSLPAPAPPSPPPRCDPRSPSRPGPWWRTGETRRAPRRRGTGPWRCSPPRWPPRGCATTGRARPCPASKSPATEPCPPGPTGRPAARTEGGGPPPHGTASPGCWRPNWTGFSGTCPPGRPASPPTTSPSSYGPWPGCPPTGPEPAPSPGSPGPSWAARRSSPSTSSRTRWRCRSSTPCAAVTARSGPGRSPWTPSPAASCTWIRRTRSDPTPGPSCSDWWAGPRRPGGPPASPRWPRSTSPSWG